MTSTLVSPARPAMHPSAAGIASEVFTTWWPGLSETERSAEIARHLFNMDLATRDVPAGATVCDIGGGWGSFSAICAGLGYRSILIDDFRDQGFFAQDDIRYQMQRRYGVERVSRDVVTQGIDFAPNSIDVFTCFDSMEHWHSSPKRLFAQIRNALKPGGRFVLACPNCVNLRKRLSTLLGTARWTAMHDWYEQEVFRGHVREPHVEDLLYIARDMGLVNTSIHGANFAGLLQPGLRALTLAIDPLLRLRPSLCSDIYLTGHKPVRS